MKKEKVVVGGRVAFDWVEEKGREYTPHLGERATIRSFNLQRSIATLLLDRGSEKVVPVKHLRLLVLKKKPIWWLKVHEEFCLSDSVAYSTYAEAKDALCARCTTRVIPVGKVKLSGRRV